MRPDRRLLLRLAGSGAAGVALLPTLGAAAVDAAERPTAALQALGIAVGAVVVLAATLLRARWGTAGVPILAVLAAASFGPEGRALAVSPISVVLATLGVALTALAAGREEGMALHDVVVRTERALPLRSALERIRDGLVWALLLVPATVLIVWPPPRPDLPSLPALCWVTLGFGWTLAAWSNWIAPRANEEFELARLRRTLAGRRGSLRVALRIGASLGAAAVAGTAAYLVAVST